MRNRPIGIKRVVQFHVVILSSLILSACVKPVEPTPTPDLSPQSTTPIPVATTPSSSEQPSTPSAEIASFSPDTITQWLRQYGAVVNNLSVFDQIPAGPDEIVGYSFQNAANQRCAGFVQTTAATAQIWSGDYRCNAGSTPVILGSTLFALTDGQPYVAAYGYVDPGIVPNASAVAVEFPNSESKKQMLKNYGFVVLQPGLTFPSQGVIMDQGGNLVTIAPVQ